MNTPTRSPIPFRDSEPALPATATLLVTCLDRPGLVAAVSGFVAQLGGNIVHADQHSDRNQNRFYMHLTWDLERSTIELKDLPAAFEALKKQHGMTGQLFFSREKPKVAIFTSRTLHCLYDLLMEYKQGSLHCDIAGILSNHTDAESVAQHFDIPFVHTPMDPKDKPGTEAKQRQWLADNGIGCIVLARYMQVLSPEFTAEWEGRAINIHHGFLPAFQGARPYHQAFERGVKIIGATAHYVTSELDQGPILVQDVMPVSHRDSVHDLMMKGRDMERRVLTQAVRLHLEHRVLVSGNRTIVFS
jgi:formyltetrahydrofolate deformylase